MKRKMRMFCSVIFARHIGYYMGIKLGKNPPHNADYEVCRDMWCRMAYWLERTFRLLEGV